MKKLINWFKNVFSKSSYINSFRHIKPVLWLLISLFSLCFFVVDQILNIIFQKLTENLNLEQLELQYNLMVANGLNEMPVEATTEFLSVFNQKMTVLFVYLLAYIVLFVLLWVLFEGLILTKLYNKKFNKKTMFKFFILNICAFPLFFVLLLLFGSIIKIEFMSYVVLFFLLPLYLHFLSLTYYLLFKHDKFKFALSRAFSVGAKKIYRFVVPVLLIIITMMILLAPFAYLTRFIQDAEVFIFGLPFVILWAWARMYYKVIVDKVDTK